MSAAPRSSPAIYPRCCFHLAPTYNAWCMFRAADIRRLRSHPDYEGQDIYFHNNLPVRWVRVVGVVVAIDDFAGRRVFTVDDSSGACIEAATPYNEKAASAPLGLPGTTGPHADIDVGAVVDVKGALATFRDELQVRIERVTRVPSTGDEVALWEKRARFGREVLARPWVLAPGDVLRAREEAEQEDREADRRTRRLREAIAASSLSKGNKYAWRNKSGRA